MDYALELEVAETNMSEHDIETGAAAAVGGTEVSTPKKSPYVIKRIVVKPVEINDPTG